MKKWNFNNFMVFFILSFIAFAPDFITPAICGRWIDEASAAGNVSAGFTKIFILMIAFGIIAIIASFLLIKRTKKWRFYHAKISDLNTK
jgi:hypothetical protein